MTRPQESIGSCATTASFAGKRRRRLAIVFLHLVCNSREVEGGGGRQPAHHVPLVLLLLSSPFPRSAYPFSCVLRLRRKCAVSSCTGSVLSSVHVNKCTHPEYIILVVHAVQRAADRHFTPAQPHQSDTDIPATPSTTVNYNPRPAPTAGDVAPSMASQLPPPPSWVLSYCLGRAPASAGSFPQGGLRDALTFVQETELKLSFFFPFSLL